MRGKKIIILGIFIIALIFSIIFIKINYNFFKKGNNISNKSADEVKDYILNIESYQAMARIIIKSNKIQNTYIVKQQYNKCDNIYIQEVLEPSSIAGTQFSYDGENLKIENTRLNISKIYENYNYIESNELSLVAFIDDYKQSNLSKCIEENGIIILETEVKNANKYISSKKLYINKKQAKIEKMEINDRTQNTKIYILYNEIEINTCTK